VCYLAQTADLARLSNEYVIQLGEEDIVVKLLKASCNQAIVSPAWMNLKLNVMKEFPFKDIKHGWNIYIFFSEQEIIVIHKKKEHGVNKETQKEEFSFVWELKFTFSQNMEKLKFTTYGITDFEIMDMDPDRSSALRSKVKVWRVPTFLPLGSPRGVIARPLSANALSRPSLGVLDGVASASDLNDGTTPSIDKVSSVNITGSIFTGSMDYETVLTNGYGDGLLEPKPQSARNHYLYGGISTSEPDIISRVNGTSLTISPGKPKKVLKTNLIL